MRRKPKNLSRRCARMNLTLMMYLESMSQMKKMGGLVQSDGHDAGTWAGAARCRRLIRMKRRKT